MKQATPPKHLHEGVPPAEQIHYRSEGETSIDRMTEKNDTGARIEDVRVMLCDRLTLDIELRDSSAPFGWRDGKVLFTVHDGVQAVT
jgi:hypothetical protein